uniref:peptidylprolyl isomerase n=1 Tax=Hemiselmis tepida TaxID=464990 RepID=A0A7S0YLV0_9CRYP
MADAFMPTPALRPTPAPARAAAASSSALSSLNMQDAMPRRSAFSQAAGVAAASWFAATTGAKAAATLGPAVGTTSKTESGLQYTVVTQGKGPKPRVGDLVAIRFTASYNGKEFDNTFKTQNSYYYRVGSESVIAGLDQAVRMMRVGDKWDLKIPSNLAFGDKGIKSSPGKPKIPGGAEIEYTVLLETFPGAEEEILDLNGLQE